MGLSASQSRLLSLTSRLSDLELQSQSISNSKIRLSQESAQASEAYNEALDKETLKVYNGDTSSYINATAYNLTTYDAISSTDKQRFIKTSSGQLLVSEDIANAYEEATSAGTFGGNNLKTLSEYKAMSLEEIENDTSFVEFVAYAAGTPDLNGDGKWDWDDYEELISEYGSSKMEYYQNIFIEALESGGCTSTSDDNLNSSEWLTNQISAGNLYLYEYDSDGGDDGTGDYVNVSWTSGDSSLEMVSDDTTTAKAEAEYESTMADIETKDKRFDLELKNIDTEHTALQTEIDSVTKVIDKNVERSFKMFNA